MWALGANRHPDTQRWGVGLQTEERFRACGARALEGRVGFSNVRFQGGVPGWESRSCSGWLPGET